MWEENPLTVGITFEKFDPNARYELIPPTSQTIIDPVTLTATKTRALESNNFDYSLRKLYGNALRRTFDDFDEDSETTEENIAVGSEAD